ncbi:hypothetical protein HX127_11185 [Acinetobacter sp. 256-1]|uniref:hypothetical protein n=1 Tax=Acinetobacter sp. 256-1 TaxID=2746721 RepID=UPI0025774513|nr:hypothetical protein [Acinetobacter sp. 256-1]MDM1758125.1 hypothetical protein [Acinetobacter sp. 256-1]
MSETQTVLGTSAVTITQKVTVASGTTSFFGFLVKVDKILNNINYLFILIYTEI